MDYFTKLNKQQEKAVNHLDGPCLVLAGAGSGKTKVLTQRIVELIEKGVADYNILAITFTNKAAKEMRGRLNLMIPDSSAFVGTFHALGLRVIRENLEAVGLQNNFTIIDSDDQLSIIKRILKDKHYDPKVNAPSYIRNRISFIKNEMLSDGELVKFFNTPPEKVALEVYQVYKELLRRNNSVDFDDLLLMPVKLFLENKKTLERYQEHFKYILIDEYQDTNEVQYKLTKLLATKYKNIFVVGDPDQAIYAFRYANYKNILNFERDYKEAKVIPLEENFRSTNEILKTANAVIKHNKERKDKELFSGKDSGIKPKYLRTYDGKNEATTIISQIKEMLLSGYVLSEIAILYRTNAQSRIIEEEFLKENIPYKVVGSYYFYNRREIKDLMAYLKLILNESDEIALRRVINVPKRGIGLKAIANLEEKALREGITLFDGLDSGKELKFKELIKSLKKKSESISLSELIDVVLEDSGLKSELEREKSLESEIRLENLAEFKSITHSFEERTGSINLGDFLEEVSLIADMSEHQAENKGVNLMTVHSAKGLEFDVVFLVGLEEGLFPHSNSFLEEGGLEEERRLCYVGITRARERLFLTNAKRRLLYGRETHNIPSRFIKEIDEELLEYSNLAQKEQESWFESQEMYHKNDIIFKPGDIVKHTVYGPGVITQTDGEYIVIAFAKKYGIKKLLKNHKSIQKGD